MNSDFSPKVFTWKWISQSLPIFHSNMLPFHHPQSLKANNVDSTKFEGCLKSTLIFKSLSHILCWIQVQANIWLWSCLWANFSPAYLYFRLKSESLSSKMVPGRTFWNLTCFKQTVQGLKLMKERNFWPHLQRGLKPHFMMVGNLTWNYVCSSQKTEEAMRICNLQRITNCKSC